ncbi:hypothetical protein ACQQ2N_12085 [Dokdonella sp. MW10]|uniref:hypothetical protein n=1 Tax=Dokdonella sp. MW10 TaxID=2992926 RepID=UPI003F81823E
MSNSLGSFSVDVMANIAKFESDLGRAERVAQQQADKIKRVFTGLAGTVGVTLGAGALAAWVKSSIDAADRADELAQKVGVSTQEMSKLTTASKFAATDLDGVTKGMQKLAQNAAAAAGGQKAQADAFAAIGVQVKDVNGKVRDSFALFDDVAKKFEGYEGGITKTALAVKLFGKSGTDLIPMFNDWNGNVAEAIKLSDEFGATISNRAGAAAAKFNDTVAKLGIVVQGVGNQLAEQLLPALNRLADATLRAFRSDGWKSFLSALSSGTKLLVDNIDRIGKATVILGQIVGVVVAGKMVNAFALAAWECAELTKKIAISTALSRELGLAGAAAGAGMASGIGASLKQIGLLPGAIGAATAAFSGWQIGTYLREEFVEVRLAGIALMEGLSVAWERMKQFGMAAWEGVKHSFLVYAGEVVSGVDKILGIMRYVQIGQGNIAGALEIDGWRAKLQGVVPAAGDLQQALAAINREADAQVEAIRRGYGELAEYEIQTETVSNALKAFTDRIDGVSYANIAASKGSKEYAAAVKEINMAAAAAVAGGVYQAKAHELAATAIKRMGLATSETAPIIEDGSEKAKKFADAQHDLAMAMSRIRAESGPQAAAVEKFNQRMLEAQRQSAKMADADLSAGKIIEYLGAEANAAGVEFRKTTAEIAKQTDVLGEYMRELDDDRALLGLSDRQKAIEVAVRSVVKAYEALDEEQKKQAGNLDEIVAKVREAEGAYYDQSKAVDAAKAIAQKWVDQWMTAVDQVSSAIGDFVVGNIRSVRDFGRAMVDMARDMVSQMIAEFAKLAAIKMLTGSGASWGGIATQAFGALMGGGSGGGGGFNVGSVASSGMSSYLNNAATNYITSLFGGATAAAAGAGMAGVGALAAGTYTAAAPWVTAASATGAWTTGVSAGVTGIGAGSGAAAGGTAAAGGASAMAAALSWIPIIGAILFGISKGDAWYAEGWDPNWSGQKELGNFWGRSQGDFNSIGGNTFVDWTVMATDSLLRGIFDDRTAAALSGSSGIARAWGYRKPSLRNRDDAQGFDWNFGGDGATGNLWAQIKAKGGWFVGDKKWTETAELSAEMQKSITQFWDSVTERMTRLARTFNANAPDKIDAAFRSEFNKKGELTKTIGTILGKQYEEDWETFQRRIVAEQDVAFLDALDMGRGVSAFAEQWRASIEELTAGVQMLMTAADDVRRGQGLLTTGDTKSADSILVQTATLIEDLAVAGEDLASAYNRVYGSTKLLEQMAGLMGVTFDKTREGFIRFATDLVDVAGGMDRAGALVSSFMSNYYSQQELAAKQMAEQWASADAALEGIGLKAGTSMQDLRTAFEGGMASMTAEQIVQWLEAADALAVATNAQRAYNEAIAKAALDYIGLISGLEVELGDNTGFAAARAQVEAWEMQTIAQANALARAAGLQGAAEKDLDTIRRAATRRIEQMIDALRAQVRSGAEALGYINPADTLDYLNQRISELSNTTTDAGGAINAAIDAMRERMGLLLGDLSPFNDERKLQIALEGFAAGTVDPNQVLEIGRRLYASSAAYNALFDQVMATANAGANALGPTGNGSQVNASGDTRTLEQLIAARDEMLAAQRPIIAQQTARYIAELAGASNETYAAIAEAQGWNLERLAEDMGLSLKGLEELLGVYTAEAMDVSFIDVGEMIRDALYVTRDDLVAAITGNDTNRKPAADSAADAAVEDDSTVRIQDGIDEQNTTARAGLRIGEQQLDVMRQIVAGIAALRGELGRDASMPRSVRPTEHIS